MIFFFRYDLDNLGIERVVRDYEQFGFPLDIFVLDMDWHTKEGFVHIYLFILFDFFVFELFIFVLIGFFLFVCLFGFF